MRLRALETEDISLMYRVENATTMWDVTSTPQPLSRGAITQFIHSTTGDIYKDGQLRLVIEIKTESDYQAIGFIDLIDFSPRNLRAEVGIAILPQFHNKGYGLEALKLVEQYACEMLFIHQLFAYVAIDNTPALTVFAKAGYEQAGRLKDWLKYKDSYKTVVLLQKFL